MKESEQNKLRKLWWKASFIIVVVLVFILSIFLFAVYYSTKKTVDDKMHDPVETIDPDVTEKKLQETERLHILLLGIDANGKEKGRSDAIMLMQLDPNTEEMKIISIPRDVRTEIIGKGFEDKINHAFAFGGASMAIATVENFLDIEIDYFVSINMDGLVELVDELGTITVENEVAWSDKYYEFPQGLVEMDGEQTMAFVRMRQQDPHGDLGRTLRQRKVIEGILHKGATVGSVPKFTRLVDVLGENMATNMNFSDMTKLFSRYKQTRKNITEYMIQGMGQKIDDIYYIIVSEEEVQKVQQMLTENKH